MKKMTKWSIIFWNQGSNVSCLPTLTIKSPIPEKYEVRKPCKVNGTEGYAKEKLLA